MLSFLLSRASQFLISLLGITVLTFGIIHLAPGDPTDLQTTMNPRISAQAKENLKKLYGLDRPLHIQYFDWLRRFLTFDLGHSFVDGEAVSDKILGRLPVTLMINVISVFAVALLAPVLSPHDPNQIEVEKILQPPGSVHPFGTDPLGRDVLSRMMWGARISLWVGFVAIGIAILIGVFVGAIAGFYGGRLDAFLMRWVDIMLSIPTFFLILAVIAILEPSIWNIMIVIGLTGWMGVARLVWGQFLSLRETDYVTAARALGAGDFRMIFLHILPNALSPVYVSAVLGIAGAILTESALSFLGLGVQPPPGKLGKHPDRRQRQY